MAQTLPAVPQYVFHAYLLHGMIRVARFLVPDIEPWAEDDTEDASKLAKAAVHRHLRLYLGPSLCQLSSDDLEGLIIAASGEPAKPQKDLATQLIDLMTAMFWSGGDAPWLQYGIFASSPDKDMIPCSFGAIVFEAMCCLIHNFQITFAYEPSLTLMMHHHYGNISSDGVGAVISAIKHSFQDTFSREILVFAQIGANESSDFYRQDSLFEEESDAWRYSFCLQMAINRISSYEIVS